MSVEQTVCLSIVGFTVAVVTLFVVGSLIIVIRDKNKERP